MGEALITRRCGSTKVKSGIISLSGSLTSGLSIPELAGHNNIILISTSIPTSYTVGEYVAIHLFTTSNSTVECVAIMIEEEPSTCPDCGNSNYVYNNYITTVNMEYSSLDGTIRTEGGSQVTNLTGEFYYWCW